MNCVQGGVRIETVVPEEPLLPDRQTDRQTERQTDRQKERQAHKRQTCIRSRAVDGSELLKLDLPSLMVPSLKPLLNPNFI